MGGVGGSKEKKTVGETTATFIGRKNRIKNDSERRFN